MLANRKMAPLEAAAYCSPAKGALGITKELPYGQVAIPWVAGAVWGLGRRDHDGALTESVALKAEHADGRSVLFLWTRPPANVPLLVALGRWGHWVAQVEAAPMAAWAPIAAVLARLPDKSWTSAGALAWKRTGPGRVSMPRPIPSAAAKKMIREG